MNALLETHVMELITQHVRTQKVDLPVFVLQVLPSTMSLDSVVVSFFFKSS